MKFKIICLVVSCIILTVACQKPLTPQYIGINNLQVNKLSISQSAVSGELVFFNPNKFSLRFKHSDVNILLNDKKVANWMLDSTILIPQNNNFTIPVSFILDQSGLLNNVFQLLTKKQVKINAEGFVRIKRSGLGFTIPIRYEGYQQLDSLLQRFN